VTVVAKVGMREQHGKVRTAEGIVEVQRSPDGTYEVPAPADGQPGRVKYDDEHDVLEIERPGVHLSIQFRGETEHTVFEFGGRTYEVATMDFGAISIKDAGRPAVQGHVTVSGVRLLSVAPDLQPIQRELAFGLALRSDAISKGFWREDEPFLEGIKERIETDLLEGDARLHPERGKSDE